MENKKEKQQKSSSSLLGRLFGSHKQRSIFEEEQIQSPTKTIIKNFFSSRLSRTAVIVFCIILLFVIVGPFFFPMDLSYQESSQQNISPGYKLMRIPKELNGNIASIGTGAKFGIGASTDGKVYVWGDTRLSRTKNMATIPKNMGKVTLVAAGYDHAVAVDENNNVYVWGNDRAFQADVPSDIKQHGNIIQIDACYQTTVALTDQGYAFFWGNENLNDVHIGEEYQGKLSKILLTTDTAVGLTKNGQVVVLGNQNHAVSNIPQEALAGVKDLAVGSQTAAAITRDGKIVVWGNTTHNELSVPELSSKPVKLYSGSYHYVAQLEDGSIVSWGDDMFNQTNVPTSKISNTNIKEIYSGYFQNYAITDSGKAITWGLRGYLLGTDDFGRDILTRIVNGGKLTMTIGFVAVIISTLIGVIVGAVAGFFGGTADMLLMRLAEIILALPFLPFAMILSALVANSMGEMQRIYMIMVVLGLLSWAGLSRIVRAQVLAEREKEFVIAAKAMGVKEMGIVFKHIVPNVISIIIVNATLSFATCLLTESSLSYLGFGVALPRPTWGNMLYGCNNSVTIQTRWWQWVFPAIILAVCVICINTIGDGMRDAIDPKSQDR